MHDRDDLAARARPDADTKVAILSSESIASTSPSQPATIVSCAACGAPLASDQRYCLECGERRMPMSSLLLGSASAGAAQPPRAPAIAPPAPAASAPGGEDPSRGNVLTVIAGVGVLLLAVGVGVLIGRSGATKQAAAPAPVISVSSAGTSTAGSSGEASFTSDWPAETSGYTVQLQTLAQSGTTVSAIEAAKSAATAKGAKSVGALKSEEFSSLTPGSYVIYSGVYHQRKEAEKALASLKKSFPGAQVVKVSNGGGSSGSTTTQAKETEPPTTSPGGVGTSESKPAPPSVLNSLKGARGKSYEEKSKSLPDVVETG
ncbi:MAG TPA: hypothetical protein VKV16_07210 [Solirubrobacteraceae bacterium]|nr:hypothetical protein [Solirubrobacteraceae bacterium]